MGKQSRNKRHRQGKSKGAPELSGEGSSEKAPALLQRLRHADEGTRQAALTALEQNPRLLDHASSSSSHHRDRLLEAVRDQLMGSSIEVSTQACAVMISYLSMNAFNEDLAASWLNLLVQRLQTCLDRLRPASGSPSQRLQILRFASRCLECFALLIEVNPVATRRMVRSQIDVLSVLHPWLQHLDDAEIGSASESVELRELACQCLHSVLDNNEEIVSPWFDQAWETQSHSRMTVLALESVLTTDAAVSSPPSASAVSSLARLHAAGAWLSIWDLIPAGNVSALAVLLQSHLDVCVRLLVDELVVLDAWIQSTNSKDSLSGMLERVDATYGEWRQLQQDAKLENDVVASQVAKRESARSIARRLKSRMEEESSRPPPPPSSLPSTEPPTEPPTAMVVEPDDGEAHETSKASSAHASARNPEAEWEVARCEWFTTIRPAQLSLEIFLNVTSLADDDTSMNEDDYGDARMDDADGSTAALDAALVATLLQRRLPDVVQRLLSCSTTALLRSSGTTTMVRTSLGDVVQKTGTLLGHAMANVPSWNPTETLWADLLSFLHQFVSLFTDAVEDTPNGTAVSTDSVKDSVVGVEDAVEGITSALVMGVQAKRLECSELAAVMSCLLHALQVFASPAVQRNSVCLIGLLLCAEPNHPQPLNEQVCRALLALLDAATEKPAATATITEGPGGSSSMVAAEVCNVLMDLYGSDDEHCHRTVYDALGVSKCMERAVPFLRRTGEVETAINAKRFVQYMKDHS